MKKGLIFLVLFIVCLLGVLIVAPSFIDWNRHKPTIIAQLAGATGHDYAIDGPLEFTVLPFPKLLIEGLTISNGQEQLLTLKRLDVQVELMPLIKGNINIKSVSLIDPVIKVDIDKEGKMSWMTPELDAKLSGNADSANASAEQKDVSQLISLGGIEIENGVLEYADARNGAKETIKSVDLSLSAANLFSGPFVIEGTLNARNQKIDVTLNTGRMEKGAETISMSADIALPELKSNVNYSGVVGIKGAADVQGETSFKTQSLNGLLKGLGLSDVPYLARPVETAGILSFTENKLAYRNLSASFDGQPIGGSVEFTMAQGATPAMLDAVLTTTKPVVIDKFMPKGEPNAPSKALASFLPQSITVPMNVDANVALTAEMIEYNKTPFSNFALRLTKTGKEIKMNTAANMKDNGKASVEAAAGFGSVSVSEKTGAVTYSDPAVNYKASVEVASAQSLAGLLPPETIKTAQPYLSKGLRSSLSGTIQPMKASITAGSAALNETNLNYSGSYALKGAASGRDLVTVNLEAEDINIDQWMVKSDEAATPKAKINVSDYTKLLDLPFNLSVVAVSTRASFGGVPYQNLQLKASTAGKQLKIDTVSIADTDGNNALVSGTVGDVVALKDMSLSVSGKTGDLEKLLKSFDVDTSSFPARVGAAELVSEFRGQPDNLAFTANVKALRGTMEASGTLANMLETPKVSGLTLRLRHPSYVELARIFKPDFESGVDLKKNLDLFASMKNENGVYSFSELKALVGPSTITGDLRADMTGEKPVVKATIQADTLPLDSFLGHKSGTKGTTRVTPQAAQGASKWSRDSIDMSWLHNFDVDIRATAGTLSYGNWTVAQARLDTVLNNGVLQLQEVSGKMYEGTLKLTGQVDATKDPKAPISAKGNLVIDNVQLEPFVQSFSGSKLVKARGPISMNTTFATTGKSQAELIFSLQGNGTMSGKELVFEGFDLARLSRALSDPTSSFSKNFGRVLEATTSGGTTNFDTLDSVYDIKSGVVNITKLELLGATASVKGAGNVNLPLWTIDLETNVVLNEPEDAPVLKTVFKGPLDNPGSTFGQNALNQYFNKQIEGMVLNPLLDSLQKKGILPTAPNKQPAPTPNKTGVIQPSAPQKDAPAANDNSAQSIQEEPSWAQPDAAPSEPVVVEPEPQAAPAPQPKAEPTPEEAIFGIIQGVLGGQ